LTNKEPCKYRGWTPIYEIPSTCRSITCTLVGVGCSRLTSHQFVLSILRPSRCVTSRKVAGSIADGVIRNFKCRDCSGRTMILTEMSISVIRWGEGKGSRCLGPLSCADRLEILEVSTSFSPKGLFRPLQENLLRQQPKFRTLSDNTLIILLYNKVLHLVSTQNL